MKRLHSTTKQVAYIILGLAIFVLVVNMPLPQPMRVGTEQVMLTQSGRMCLALLLLAIIYWITEVLPFHITAVAIMLLMPVLGVTDGLSVIRHGEIVRIQGIAAGYKEIVRMSFGNDLILFFLGVFLLSGAFTETSLGKRLTLWMLRLMGTSTKMVILGFLTLGTVLSMWISDVGVAAMLLPVSVGILKNAGVKPLKSNFGKALMIASCWGPGFGGIATPAGSGPNPVAISFMRDLCGVNISFLDWMKIGVPASLMLIPFGWALLMLIFPPEIKRIPINKDTIKTQLVELGQLSRREKSTMIVFGIVIVLWIFNPFIRAITGGHINLPISMVSILGGMLLFMPPFNVMSWERASRHISWESIILIMASLGLGMMTYYTGAARWLSLTFLGGVKSFSPVVLIFAVIASVTILKIFLASNTVTGIVIIPILISLAQLFSMDPWILVCPAALTSSLGFILVTQTPTNIIPYTAGYFSIRDFAKVGVIMSIIISVMLTLVIALLGPLTGVYAY